MNPDSPQLTLYGYWRSSSTWRVRLMLACKQLAYQYVPVNLVEGEGEQHRESFRRLNPMGQVPLLVVEEQEGPFTLTQSVAIAEYLEERFPQVPLLPADRRLRARCRQAVEIVNSGIQPLQNLALLRKLEAEAVDARVFVKQFIAQGLLALETLAQSEAPLVSPGDQPGFLLGSLTLADLFLIPQLYNARRFDLRLEAYPRLVSIEAQCETLAAFQAAHPNAQEDAPAP